MSPRIITPTRLKCVIVLAFTITLYALWTLHTNPQETLITPNKFEWRQPLSLVDNFPTLISTERWAFDYELTEQTLLAIKTNKTGDLILNANTAKQLKKAISNLPSNMTTKELQRIELLASKGLAENTGRQLSTLLIRYYHFQHALNSVLSTSNSQKNNQNKEFSFKQTILLEERYFGKQVSKQLFGQKNALNQYLYARKRINENTTLSREEKIHQLSSLQERFKSHEK